MYVVCVRLNCVCMFCCDVWFDVVWSGLIVCVFVLVCVIVMWLCGLSVMYWLLWCCCCVVVCVMFVNVFVFCLWVIVKCCMV